MKSYVLSIRMAIILLGIVAFCLSNLCTTLKGEEAFWPPDMIPHPNPPWDQPRGKDEPTIS